MRYSDLIEKTTDLPVGRHTIYSLKTGQVVIRNTGRRHPLRSERDDHRLHLEYDHRELSPRHGDFFSDYLLKVEIKPDLRMTLTEVCEHICNGADPQELMAAKHLPVWFSEWGQKTWTLQMSMYQTAGLPTELFLCGLQGLIRVYDLNDPERKFPEAFRQAFVAVSNGASPQEAAVQLAAAVAPGKLYYNRLYRAVSP